MMPEFISSLKGKYLVLQSFIPIIKELPSNRKYVIFSLLYGMTSLIIPLAAQYLVNSLALAGVWINTVGFLIIIALALIISLVLRYSQIILNEYLQREIFDLQTKRWISDVKQNDRKYFIEIFFAMKSFSKSFTTIVEIFLVGVFGLVVIVAFHPGFLVLPVLIGFTLWQVRQTTKPAIKASIHVSDKKYILFDKARDATEISVDGKINYLKARDERFRFIKRNSIKVFALYLICQLLLLGGGIYLIEASQLSIGQLVSAEIILSNIMIALYKLPDALEGVYDFETSIYKINKARGDIHG